MSEEPEHVIAEAGVKRLKEAGVRSARRIGDVVVIAPLDAMRIADLIEAADPAAYRSE